MSDPLCDADAALRGASAPMRRLHRSVRQFYAGLQMVLQHTTATGTTATHHTSSSGTHEASAAAAAATAGASSTLRAKRLFVGPLSCADLDAVAARDDTVRRSLEHLAQRDAAYRVEEQACLSALKEELGGVLSDPGLPAGEKARRVAGIAQKRRELAVKRAQRHGDTEAIEGSLRDALFAALPALSLEYGDEGLEDDNDDSGDDDGSTSDGAGVARDAGIARRRPLRPFGDVPQGAGTAAAGTSWSDDADDRAAEMSIHAMLAKALSTAASVVVAKANRGGGGKRSQPRGDEELAMHQAAAVSDSSHGGGGLYSRLGIDLMRHLTMGWHDSAAASPSDNHLGTASELVPVAARQVSLRWSAADMLLWPRQGQLHGDQRNAADIAAAFARDGPLVARALERHAASDAVIVQQQPETAEHSMPAGGAAGSIAGGGGHRTLPSPGPSPNETSMAPPAVVAVPRSSAPIPPSPAPSPNGVAHVAAGAAAPAVSAAAEEDAPVAPRPKASSLAAPRVPTRYSQSFDDGSAQPQHPFSAEDAVDACGHEVKAAAGIGPWHGAPEGVVEEATHPPPSPRMRKPAAAEKAQEGTFGDDVRSPPSSPKGASRATATTTNSSSAPSPSGAPVPASPQGVAARPDVSAAFLTEHPAALPTTATTPATAPDPDVEVPPALTSAQRRRRAASTNDDAAATSTTTRNSRPASSSSSAAAGGRMPSNATPAGDTAALSREEEEEEEPGRALASDPFGTALASPRVDAARSNLRQGKGTSAFPTATPDVSRSNARPLPRAKELALLEQSAAAERAMQLILGRAPLPASKQQPGARTSTSLAVSTTTTTTPAAGGALAEDVSFTASGQFHNGSAVATTPAAAATSKAGGTFRLVGDVPPAWAQPRRLLGSSATSGTTRSGGVVVAGDPQRVTGSELAPLKPCGLARKRVQRDSAAASIRRARSAAMDAEQDRLDGVGVDDDGDGDGHHDQPARPYTAPLPGGEDDDDYGGGDAAGSGALVPVSGSDGAAAAPPSGNYGRFVTDGSAQRAGAVFGYFPLAKSKWQSGQQQQQGVKTTTSKLPPPSAATSKNTATVTSAAAVAPLGGAALLGGGGPGGGQRPQTVDDVLAADTSENAVQRRLRLRSSSNGGGSRLSLHLSGSAASATAASAKRPNHK